MLDENVNDREPELRNKKKLSVFTLLSLNSNNLNSKYYIKAYLEYSDLTKSMFKNE